MLAIVMYLPAPKTAGVAAVALVVNLVPLLPYLPFNSSCDAEFESTPELLWISELGPDLLTRLRPLYPHVGCDIQLGPTFGSDHLPFEALLRWR